MYRSRRVAAFVLARSGSTRLPGKMLLPFGDGTVLSSVLDRLEACETVDDVVVATTDDAADDELAHLAEEAGFLVVRGSVNDVVARMVQALSLLPDAPEVIVRACADNPLLMPTVVNAGVRELIDEGADIVTPFEYATLPFGYGLVSMTTACLERIDAEAGAPAYREHVENFCFEHPESFNIRYQVAPEELTYPELCLTLDFESDYRRLIAAQEHVDGVALADQPVRLIEMLRNAEVWIEDVSLGSPESADLVLATSPFPGLEPRLGQIIVENARLGGVERFVLRYADDSRPGFTVDPLFIDRRVRRRTDTPLSFLRYAAPIATPALLAAPARGASPTILPTEKSVAAERRRGFRRPSDLYFPPQIALAPDVPFQDSTILNGVLTELSAHEESVVLVDPGVSETSLQHIATRIGPERVRRADALPNLFETVLLEASGHLSVAGEAVDYRRSSVESFWLSAGVRRARARALNGAAA